MPVPAAGLHRPRSRHGIAARSIPATRGVKREIDPFTRDEADVLIAQLYKTTSGLQAIYAAFFEFCFYTGMRPGEVMALRWSEVDTRKRSAKVSRIRIRGKIKERTKTKTSREVLLNDRALMALDKARPLTAARSDSKYRPLPIHDRQLPAYLHLAYSLVGVRVPDRQLLKPKPFERRTVLRMVVDAAHHSSVVSPRVVYRNCLRTATYGIEPSNKAATVLRKL
ncbi:tyrosine-type recombinase/integrase [Pseudomonas sp. Pseusp122]|uniref:tyrosine-type recombinase/integrase n=1 Tax=unclassified Pseudomonas TaxID=196821 RepID=UPI0039A4C4F7